MVRKTETIRKELGASGEVLRQTIEKRLSRDGIRREDALRLSAEIEAQDSKNVSTAEKELGDGQEKRLTRLKEEQDRLQRLLEQARKRVGVDGADIRQVVEIALKDDQVRTAGLNLLATKTPNR
ncbi:hypothetical protein ABIA25_001748 [Sinorhizobium fredii]|uniref:hypothetical protein n=1 Tax=Rhizobium fredii TaxID=380 RepID=UPI003515AC5E